jgi:hypothetical protein
MLSYSEVASTVAAVALPEVAIDQPKTNFIATVKTTDIDAKSNLVGFQGDFTFDERVVTFQNEPVRKAGITGGNWNVSGNVLDGPGPIRTLRVSACRARTAVPVMASLNELDTLVRAFAVKMLAEGYRWLNGRCPVAERINV